MEKKDLERFRDWFAGYTESFSFADEEHQRNISLKVKHTFHVCDNIVRIASQEARDDVLLAETVALFHDVGRFPQYARYRTFRDAESVNHGELGARVLGEHHLLGGIPAHERQTVLTAVRYHNAFKLPDLGAPEAVFFLRLIRDADKLDIWRVFGEFYESNEEERASAAGLGLPDTDRYSDRTLSYLRQGKPAPLGVVETLNDFRLVQLSWVYDLNFRTSFHLLRERGCIDRIAAHLPRTEELREAVRHLKEFAERKSTG